MTETHILVAEDEAHTRISLNVLLKRAGYKVSAAPDGASALRMLKNGNDAKAAFDLLLTDIQMPEMTGIELIRKIKSENISLPVIVFTGFGDKDTVIELLREGCEDYLDKPFSEDDLLSKIKQVMGKNQKKEIYEKDTQEHILDVERKLDGYRDRFFKLCNSVDSAVNAYKEILGTEPLSKNINIKVKSATMDKLGGDFVAVSDTAAGCDILLADVAGHDLGASYHTIMLKSFFEENATHSGSGEKLFEILNKQLLNNGTNERMVTALFLRINIKEYWAEAVSAAHPYLLRFREKNPNSVLRPLSPRSGNLLGIMNEAAFEVRRFSISPGDRIIMYTDGVNSATNIDPVSGKKVKLGDMGLRELLRKHFWNSNENMLENCWQDIMVFCKNKICDDMMMLGIEIPELR